MKICDLLNNSVDTIVEQRVVDPIKLTRNVQIDPKSTDNQRQRIDNNTDKKAGVAQGHGLVLYGLGKLRL